MDTPERPSPVDPGFMSPGPVPVEQDRHVDEQLDEPEHPTDDEEA